MTLTSMASVFTLRASLAFLPLPLEALLAFPGRLSPVGRLPVPSSEGLMGMEWLRAVKVSSGAEG